MGEAPSGPFLEGGTWETGGSGGERRESGALSACLGLVALSLVQPLPPESFAITHSLILLAQAHQVPSLPPPEGPFPPVPSSRSLRNWEAEEPRAGCPARPIRAQPSCAPFLGFSPGPPLPLGAP